MKLFDLKFKTTHFLPNFFYFILHEGVAQFRSLLGINTKQQFSYKSF